MCPLDLSQNWDAVWAGMKVSVSLPSQRSPSLSSCVRSLSLLRRRIDPILRIYWTHSWKLCPSSAQPPINLELLAPHHGETGAPEHSAWFKLLRGLHPLVLRKGKKHLVILDFPKKHQACEESRGTRSIVHHSPDTFSWCLGSLFSQGLQQFHALYVCPC